MMYVKRADGIIQLFSRQLIEITTTNRCIHQLRILRIVIQNQCLNYELTDITFRLPFRII